MGLGWGWESNVQHPWVVTALWGNPQESKEGTTKIHVERNRHKGLLHVTLDLEAWLGHPRRNIMVLQDAGLVAQGRMLFLLI